MRVPIASRTKLSSTRYREVLACGHIYEYGWHDRREPYARWRKCIECKKAKGRPTVDERGKTPTPLALARLVERAKRFPGGMEKLPAEIGISRRTLYRLLARYNKKV